MFKKEAFPAFLFLTSCLHDGFHACSINLPLWITFLWHCLSCTEKFCTVYKKIKQLFSDKAHNRDLELVHCYVKHHYPVLGAWCVSAGQIISQARKN